MHPLEAAGVPVVQVPPGSVTWVSWLAASQVYVVVPCASVYVVMLPTLS